MILNAYSGITEKEIRDMSHEQLVEAVIRLLKVEQVRANVFYGACLLPDSLADAFRGRV